MLRARTLLALTSASFITIATVSAQSQHFVRYAHGSKVSYGTVDGESIRELSGSPFEGGVPTGTAVSRESVRLLAPVEPGKVIAIGFNYRSHLGERQPPTEPPVFIKLPSSIVGPETDIVFPPGATNVHFEGELVVVIGKTASRIPPERAKDVIFGVTAGNDVSERDWQAGDLQWFRAKASDTFGPIGPVVTTGVDYNDLLLQTRVNGETVQKQRTSDLIFNVDEIVSYISQFVTLHPGDIIFTGTPGTTSAMQPGDVVEVELEHVGVLSNTIAGARSDR